MKTLHLYPVEAVDELVWPEESDDLTLSSPALRFFTDFATHKPLVIDANVSAIEAKVMMQKTHVRMKFVVNEENRFIGIVTSDALTDRKIVQKISEGFKRHEISIVEVMTPKRDLKVLDYAEVERVSIAEVVALLKDQGEQHCLVVDRKHHAIRGIFSASDISRKLHLPINIQETSSFYKVFSVTR